MILPIDTSSFRIAAFGFLRRIFGWRTYPGDAENVCRRIVDECRHPTRDYFMTSPGTYRDFWSRDFGRVVPSLLYLGYREEVVRTYRYALDRYRRGGRFSLVISPRGRLFDFPSYAPDGFAFFLNGLARLNHPLLVEEYRDFLERELRRFYVLTVDKKTGLVRGDRRFSEAQDYADRRSSCYSTVMCRLVSDAARVLALKNPLAAFDYTDIIRRNFWNGEYFYDDISKKSYITGDACILPFWAGAVKDPSLDFKIVSARMDESGITRPLAARYGTHRGPARPMIWLDKINPWQRNAVWTCLGLQYLEVLSALAPERYQKELGRFKTFVEKVKCFPEVLNPDTLRLYQSPFYRSDNAMLWAANFLALLLREDKRRLDDSTPNDDDLLSPVERQMFHRKFSQTHA